MQVTKEETPEKAEKAEGLAAAEADMAQAAEAVDFTAVRIIAEAAAEAVK